MKKIILSLIFSFATLVIFAQVSNDSVLRSKKGIPILPQQGDWAIGADAGPYLSYLGNIFNNTSNNSLYFEDYTLYARYFLSDKSALRFTLSVNDYNNMERAYVRDDAAYAVDPLTRAKVQDTRKHVYTSQNLDIAYMKFRGYGRLLGFYGVHVGFGIGRERYEYAYGNNITVVNSAPSTNWGINGDGSRTLETDYGYTKTIRAGLLAGVEYYFAPKICIGSEIALNASNSWKSQGDSKFERLNGTVVEEFQTVSSPSGRTYSSLYSAYAANYGWSLYLMFHF
jgi:hypothetical protein